MSELEKINADVDAAIERRKAWFEENFRDFAKFKEGDRIYGGVADKAYKPELAGIVRRVYLKFHPEDRTPQVFYEFDRDQRWHYSSNTEGGFVMWTTQEDWNNFASAEMMRLKRSMDV